MRSRCSCSSRFIHLALDFAQLHQLSRCVRLVVLPLSAIRSVWLKADCYRQSVKPHLYSLVSGHYTRLVTARLTSPFQFPFWSLHTPCYSQFDLAIPGNFIPIGEKVEWTENYTAMMGKLEDGELNPNYSDFIVPILIYSASSFLPQDEQEEVSTFLENCIGMTGIFPIVVISKKKSGDFMTIENTFKRMGAEVVISIENYTKEDHIKTQGRTKDILKILHSALIDVRFRLGQERNPRADWVRRKKFLLEYIHKADQEKKEEQWRREEQKRREVLKRQMEEEKRREEQRIREEQRRKEAEWREELRRKEEEKKCIIC
ncbi:translation initiation factor IF-2-like [Hyla sarda]|uniref:translation initiation factor IF-2-like n=1 Tax=Hyla sarda TaxID=327740 RepID=UPI0024C3D83D|nr:translation initiation factor IF-2-like [Hyla sarda]